jgi:hypothetical protein
VVQSFRCLPQLGLVYLTNAKTASTTIKYSMLAAAAARSGAATQAIEAHRREVGPFIENIFRHPLFGSPEIRHMTVFSVVRNPFARALSGYVSKIASGKTTTWRGFAGQFGIRPDLGRTPLSFTEFLRLVDTQPDERINAHFRPQYMNLLLPFSAPRFIGRLEAFDETVRFLENAGVAVAERKGRATRSADRIAEYYTEEAEALVARKFAPDFELFGYAPKLAALQELRAPAWNGSVSDRLMDWLSGGKFPVESLDPQARAHHEIQAEDDLDGKIARIRSIWKTERDWQHLAGYAKLAKRAERPALLRKLEERIAMLRHAHRACVENRDIFVLLEAPAARRRSSKSRKPKERLQGASQGR